MSLIYDWCDLSPEEYLRMRLREYKVSEEEIDQIVKEVTQSIPDEMERDIP